VQVPSFLNEMLHDLVNQGRRLVRLNPTSDVPQQPRSAQPSLTSEMEALISSRSEVFGIAQAQTIIARWGALDLAGQRAFMHSLSRDFGPDQSRLDAALEAYARDRSSAALSALHVAAEPRRQELLRRLNLAPGGTAALVKMREALLRSMGDDAELKAVDADFLHLFASWFNRGFLILKPIDWSTPASILEKIIQYEAVHDIGGWDELRRRLAPSDRRCFAFFHPQLGDEPLIFVEVALTRHMPAKIGDVLREDRDPLRPEEATTAVFYSISNCQHGLRGVSFGSFLIKQVVEDLVRELPGLETFVTLSPVPGLARWLAGQRRSPTILDDDMVTVLAGIEQPGWQDDPPSRQIIEPALRAATASYFLRGQEASGRLPDPVGRFHLGNGASLERINILADLSPRALREAHGVMVNYLYKIDDISANHEAFATRNAVVASSAVQQALPHKRPDTARAMAKSAATAV